MPALHRPIETRDGFLARFGEGPVRYADALDAGFTRASLQAAVDRGLLCRPRRGMVSARTPASADGPAAVNLMAVRTALRAVADGAAASHESAAILHGIALPAGRVPTAVQLVHPGVASFTKRNLHLRCSPVPDHHTTLVAGIPATTPARTAVDLARGRSLPSALVPLDSAARVLIAHATSTDGNALRQAVRDDRMRAAAREQLEEALIWCFGWAGTVTVRDALPHVDPASESPLESRSRGWFLEAGLGALNPGTPIPCPGATYWADFCSPELGVVGEADGWSKYGDTASDVRTALERERTRQRRLESEGWRVVRWTSTDGRRAVVDRMRAALHPRDLAPVSVSRPRRPAHEQDHA